MTYYLDLPPSWKIYNAFHTSLLSLHYKTSAYDKGYSAPASELFEGAPEWEVAEVLVFQKHEHHQKL